MSSTMFAQAEIDLPHMVEADLITMITGTMQSHPRTLQRAIGPSEIGHPCTRKLIHKLADHDEPVGGRDRWAAQVGTFVHAGLEQALRDHPLNRSGLPENVGQPRFLLEERVIVGTAGGKEISGNADVFDIDTGTVVDWKVVGPKMLLGYQSKGPGPQYRTQAHLYGRGFQLQGYMVRQVMIAFLPRMGELGTAKFLMGTADWANPGQRFFWSEPYDETVAAAAMARLNGLAQLLALLGPDKLLSQYPPCSDWFCPWCSGRSS